jgi:hypothetical protein
MAKRDVKVIPAGSKPLTPKTIEAVRRAENQRIAASQSRMQAMKAQAQLGVGHIDRVDSFKSTTRTTSGIAGKSGINVGKMFKGGGGIGMFGLPKNR